MKRHALTRGIAATIVAAAVAAPAAQAAARAPQPVSDVISSGSRFRAPADALDRYLANRPPAPADALDRYLANRPAAPAEAAQGLRLVTDTLAAGGAGALETVAAPAGSFRWADAGLGAAAAAGALLALLAGALFVLRRQGRLAAL